MEPFTLPVPATVAKALNRTGDLSTFLRFDSAAEFSEHFTAKCGHLSAYGRNASGHDWNGYLSFDDAARMARTGDLSAVAASDALLARFEAFSPATSARAWTDGVCGAIPNVPAFVSGHPLNMRRRIKTENEFSPLAVIADTTSSSAISAEDIRKHGIAILALVRALSATRPVELWVGGGLDSSNRQNGTWAFVRIETAPLDLSSAAHMLTHPSVSRRMIYGTITRATGSNGAWPYGSERISRNHMAEIIAPAFSHVTETLCIPGVHMNDKSVTRPVEWIEEQLARATVASLTDAA